MENELTLFEENLPENRINVRSYMPSVFVTASLPIRNVKKNTFERKFNNISMFLNGLNNVPYGKYGRLLLSLLTTHAVLHGKNGPVEIKYDSFKQLLDDLDLPKQRTKEIKEQLDCFVKCDFSYEQKIQKIISKPLFLDLDLEEETCLATGVKYEKIAFVRSMEYISLGEGEKETVVGLKIVLGDDFVNLCQNHSVPINYTTYKEINSSLGKDLYAWVVYRNNSLENGKPMFFSKQNLVNQFFTESNSEDKEATFRANWKVIKDQLALIKKEYYPELKLEYNDSGILLEKSPPVVLGNDTRYILITSNFSK